MRKAVAILFLSFTFFQLHAQILSPVLNDASLVNKTAFKGTIGYSTLGYTLKGDRVAFLNSLSVQGQYGLSHKVNLSLLYQHSWFASAMFQEWAESFLFAAAMISLKKRLVSLSLPIGTRFASSDDSPGYFEFSPTVFFTIPISDLISVNPAVELGIPVCADCPSDPLLSGDIGLGVYPTDRISFHIEYDLTYTTSDFSTGHYDQFAFGLGYKF